MSKIQISELKATGTELFEGAESFLTELQPMEASAIYGGSAHCKRSAGKRSGGSKVGKSTGKSTGKSSGRSRGRSSGKCSGKNNVMAAPVVSNVVMYAS
jgi:hypothetical protein